MEINAYDPLESERSVRLRGISFQAASEFDLSSATFDQDMRKDSAASVLMPALGYTEKQFHALVFTVRARQNQSHQSAKG